MLVGHSCGGAVNTNAATGNPNVTSLVYIAASQRPAALSGLFTPSGEPA